MKVEIPHVDLMACTACQLKCLGCTNHMALVPQAIFPAEEVKADIDAAARVLHAHVGCILGGEPLVHPALVGLMRHAAASGVCDRVQVLTNGMRLHMMGEDFWAELDWLKISIYPGKTQPENVELAKRMSAEHGFRLDFFDVASDPFRAVLTDRERSPESAQATYEGCWYKTFTRKVERGYFWRCCTSPSISQEVLGLPPETDGIALDGLTPDRLREFLDQPEAMASCTRCFGNTGPRLPGWSEVRGDREAWIEASAYAT